MDSSVILFSLATTALTPTFGTTHAAGETAHMPVSTAAVVLAQAEVDHLMRQAQVLEADGNYAEALKTYKLAGQAGHGPASKRVAELYLKKVDGLNRDYLQSVRWYSMARTQGAEVDGMEKRF